MGKTTRYVILSVTIVFTLACFMMVWTFRPGNSTDVLLKARARQGESLVNVAQPIETDPNAISKEAEFAQQVQDILLTDETFRKSIIDLLVSDESFISTVVDTVKPALEVSASDAAKAYVETYVKEIQPEVIAMIQSEVASNQVDYTSLVDSLIPSVTEAVYNDIIANVSSSVDELSAKVTELYNTEREAIINDANAYTDQALATSVLTTDEIKPLVEGIYNEYKEAVVTEIVTEVLAQLDTQVNDYIASQIIVREPALDQIPVVSEEDLATSREEIRRQAIENVLENLR